MTEFRKIGVNIGDLYNYFLQVLKISFRDRYTKNNDTLFLRGTKLMELLINNPKKD